MAAANAHRRDRKTYTFTMSVPDVVWAGVGAAFALTVFFLFGVLVGRGYVPVDTSVPTVEAPADPEAGNAAHGQVADSGQAQLDAEAPELVEPGVLKAEELAYQDQLAGQAPPKKEAAPAAGQPQAPEESGEAAEAPAESDEQSAEEPAAEPEQAALFDPDNLPAPEPGEEVYDYVYQAAAFKDRAAAEELVGRLEAENLPAEVVEGKASGSTWYRVRVPFTGTPSQTRPLRDAAESITGEKPVMVSKRKP